MIHTHFRYGIVIGVFLSFVCFPFFSASSYAQSLPQNTISVTPSLLQLDLSQTKPEGVITYFNMSDQTVEMTLSASDFSPLEDGYKLSFLTKKDAANYMYRLSSWIDFSTKTLTLPAHTKNTVTVFIQKDRLTPGGHYATILAQIQGKTIHGITIQGVLASLLFVRTNTGKEADSATIATFSPEQDFVEFPKQVILRLNNTGDTTLVPYGLVTVIDPLGRLVAKGIVNEDSLMSLPESIRRFSIPLHVVSTPFIPGVYTTHLSVHVGKKPLILSAKTTFFSQGSIPFIQLLIIGGVVGGLLFITKKRNH